MSFADATIARLPRFVRPFAERHHELIKFAIVGATTFVIDSAIFYTLKLTVLEPKPVTAKIIAGIVAVIEHDPQLTPVLITAIGALPAAAAATLALELTTPDPKRRHASIWVGPTSLRVAF